MANYGSPLEVREINCPFTLERHPEVELDPLTPNVESQYSVPITRMLFKIFLLILYLGMVILKAKLSIGLFWIVSSNLIASHLKDLISTILCSGRF